MPVKLLIADDHPLIREALTDTFVALGPAYDVSSVADGYGLLAALSSVPDTALVLLDLFMPGPDGFELLAAIRQRFPDVKVVVLTASEDPADLRQAVQLGAAGYALKSEPSHELIAVVQQVLAGDTSFPITVPDPEIGDEGGNGESDHALDLSFTHRQMEVLQLIAEGFSNKEIARQLDLSENTVKIHVSAVFRVLCVNNRTQAAVAARQYGVLPDKRTVGRADER